MIDGLSRGLAEGSKAQKAGRRWIRLCFLSLTLFFFAPLAVRSQVSPSLVARQRPVTMADVIGVTRLEVPDYLSPNFGQVVYFSPDGKRFVLALKKGNLDRNTNDFSLLLYQTADALHAPKPDVLLKMSSSSNRSAISQIRWLADSDTLVFLGENPGETSQLYSFQIGSRTLKKLTNQPTAVVTYDITEDGHTLAFLAQPPRAKVVDEEQEPSREVVIEGQYLDRILAGDYALPRGLDLFWQMAGSSPRLVRLEPGYFPSEGLSISISPDGRYVLLPVGLGSDQFQPEWSGYSDARLREILAENTSKNTPSWLHQYLLYDSQNMSAAPLIDAPIIGKFTAFWSQDAKSVFLTSYLSLNVPDSAERKAREQVEFPVEVKVPGRECRRVAKENFPVKPTPNSPVEVSLEQDVNTPPKLYVTDSKSHQKTLLLDLNPQFSELEFGRVETIEWEASGAKMIGGLYLPRDYQPGKRYPLVIQTHGFDPKEFSMSGISDWSSGHAARLLAARGILVLQSSDFKDRKKDYGRIGNDRSIGTNVQEAFKNFDSLIYEGAIDSLDKKGIIDRNRVGIVGFSRTVCFVAYALTHSKYRFAAANLVDGIGCGYFDEITSPEAAWDFNALNGGAPPFGEGLKVWMKNSPGFNLDKVNAPIRLVALLGRGAVLGDLWEWYASLSLQKKPVDFILIPGATHLVEKPRERVLAQQGLVDWFVFWLKGEEDSNPVKADQYARWRALRKEGSALSAVK